MVIPFHDDLMDMEQSPLRVVPLPGQLCGLHSLPQGIAIFREKDVGIAHSLDESREVIEIGFGKRWRCFLVDA
jgi:hypothetical protein